MVDSADVVDTVVIADAVSDPSLQNSHLSLSSSSDSPSPPKSHHKLPSVPFPPKACATSPSHATSHHPPISHPPYSAYRITTRASAYSCHFPHRYHLHPEFVHWYQLGDELGADGYGFVLMALHRLEMCESRASEQALRSDQTTCIHMAIPEKKGDENFTSLWHEVGRPQVHGYDLLGIVSPDRCDLSASQTRRLRVSLGHRVALLGLYEDWAWLI